MVFLLGIFARIVKVTDFAQVINFREKAHGKIYPHKVDKNNRESMNLIFYLFIFFFQQNSKTKFIVPSSIVPFVSYYSFLKTTFISNS